MAKGTPLANYLKRIREPKEIQSNGFGPSPFSATEPGCRGSLRRTALNGRLCGLF
jgi:hypothetical protein